ncbi:hypothetical protein KC19_3G151800 [Ceratodon purpureus]|uniref:Uncharacterized protein n=1 Tax=Ceratodon purpureus TaxID=3225 RepID=A0A8T0IM58_CERPU|nr:hypothetical protein KC19_3G151800 [Ceratodon purpureus]
MHFTVGQCERFWVPGGVCCGLRIVVLLVTIASGSFIGSFSDRVSCTGGLAEDRERRHFHYTHDRRNHRLIPRQLLHCRRKMFQVTLPANCFAKRKEGFIEAES